MRRLLRDRFVHVLLSVSLLCVAVFAGMIAYQRWRFVHDAYAEAARFGYSEATFLAAEEHCGDPWILFIPPSTCNFTIYFTTDMTHDQLTQVLLDVHYATPATGSGSIVAAQTLIWNIRSYGGKTITINGLTELPSTFPAFAAEKWIFEQRHVMTVTYWPLNPKFAYAIEGTPIHKNIIGVGARR